MFLTLDDARLFTRDLTPPQPRAILPPTILHPHKGCEPGK